VLHDAFDVALVEDVEDRAGAAASDSATTSSVSA
jgi:hypothetical protein